MPARSLTRRIRLGTLISKLCGSTTPDSQILEMTLSTSGNNAINRWKEGAGIPQSKDGENFFRRATNLPKDRPVPDKSFLTPTAAEFSTAKSQVVPFVVDVTGKAAATSSRPALESRDQVETALAAARTRQPRLPLQSEDLCELRGLRSPGGPRSELDAADGDLPERGEESACPACRR